MENALEADVSARHAELNWLREDLAAMLSACPAGGVPDGFVLVPREPTEAMLIAAGATPGGVTPRGGVDHLRRMLPKYWAAMIRAYDGSASASGWIVGSGGAIPRWRAWGDCGAIWAESQSDALFFARREDAEAFAREDEDAWIVQRAPLPAAHAPETAATGADHG